MLFILRTRVVIEDRAKMRLHSLEVLEEDIGKHDTENEKQLRNDDVEDSSS